MTASLCFAANQADTPINYGEDAVLRAVQLCEAYRGEEWVIVQMMKLLPDAQEMKQYNIWKNLANIIQLQMNQNSMQRIIGELRGCCNNAIDNARLTDDKLILTIFCFGFCSAFKYLQQQTVAEYIPVILHAGSLL